MKRLTALFVILSLLFAVACGASHDAPGTVSEAGSESDTEASYYACGPAEQSENPGERSEVPGEQSEESEAPAEQSEESEAPAEQSVITFLSAQDFTTYRTAEDVSKQFKTQYDSFALELFKKSFHGDSALVSPLSALIALQMAANGAKGQTSEEMAHTLGGSMATEEMNRQLFNYWKQLENFSGNGAAFRTANAVWMTDREDFKVKNEFIYIINNTFDAAITRAPFNNAAVDAINEWCKKNTDGMIPDILGYDDVNYDTIMVLLNAICFDALWDEQYEKYQCIEADFRGKKGDTVVNMMYSDEGGYISGEHETGFFKTYRGRFAFLALLPEEGMSMSEYLASLDGERFASLIRDARGPVHAGIPQFKYDWSGSLVPALKAMGMTTPFTRSADFSGLGVMRDDSSIRISDVYQKTHIEVDPSGTKAAAVTAVMLANEGMAYDPSQEWHTVILDRPFVYAIVDTGSFLPVFIGCMTDIG